MLFPAVDRPALHCHDVSGAVLFLILHFGSGCASDPLPVSNTSRGPARVASVAVVLSAPELSVGAKAQATATLRDSAGSTLANRAVAWSSTASMVASVTSDGVVAALAPGAASVVATSDGRSGSAALTVAAPVACELVTDHLQRDQPASVPRPGYLQSVTDRLYGTAITRITGEPGTPILTEGGQTLGTWSQVNTHNYSKDPAWSADQSLIILKRVQGVNAALFLDGMTYRPVFTRPYPSGSTETRWHPLLPDAMVVVGSNATVWRWNVRTGALVTLFSVSGFTAADFSYEGNLSDDARYVAIRATRSSDGKRVGFRADLVTGAKGPDIDFAANAITNADVVSVSALGTYIVVSGQMTGATTCCGGAADASKIFAAATGTYSGQFWSEYGRPSHYDLAVDLAGNEVAVGLDKSSFDGGRVIMRRLDNGAVTVLTKGGFAGHTSSRNSARPGWAYVTHSYNGPAWPPYRDEVFAVKLDGSQTIERYGNMHSLNSGGDYDAEPHAVPAPDGRRVLFASVWGNASLRPIHAYVVDARPLCR